MNLDGLVSLEELGRNDFSYSGKRYSFMVFEDRYSYLYVDPITLRDKQHFDIQFQVFKTPTYLSHPLWEGE